jgi:hypothetical protein
MGRVIAAVLWLIVVVEIGSFFEHEFFSHKLRPADNENNGQAPIPVPAKLPAAEAPPAPLAPPAPTTPVCALGNTGNEALYYRAETSDCSAPRVSTRHGRRSYFGICSHRSAIRPAPDPRPW